MRLHINDVLARAHQRGYTHDEIRDCLVDDLGGGWFEVDTSHESYPKHQRDIVKNRMGLGDYITTALSAIGITEERVSKAIGRPCGCSKRAEALNQLGRKIGIG